MVTSEEVRYFLCWCRWCVDVNVRGKRNGAECWGGVVLIPPLSLLEDLEDLEDLVFGAVTPVTKGLLRL